MRGLFKSRVNKQCGSSSSSAPDSALTRAEVLCKDIKRPGKSSYKSRAGKPYGRAINKQFQKNLVVVDYQGDKQAEEVVALTEYHKIFDGCMRYNSDMNEIQIRNEIVRLLQQKESITHNLSKVQPGDFNFVHCANRKI